MEFVIEVLIIFFQMTNRNSRSIMLKIHEEGAAICGTFTKDIAETFIPISIKPATNIGLEYEHPKI